ncbi:uncharacterized protein LOC124176911 isoform X1 [Neodiprion fabricii]|uniref:uncharacterized protein LOC124176911 isoform X1 n=1 Tax=Neodiprion fabricii TaxID=2872261 RepID=UPI001ED90C3A|nr:uncharacterized protein LOC124176911 isoform X1 [Neodiprion fabricii]XP_046414736.1 uncharacterized protein LOC124176911 isoform X1 [Neodiprion fabricii]
MDNKRDLPGFAEEIKDLEFNGFLDWFVAFNDVTVMWKAQPTYIMVQVLCLVGGFITLLHALKSGRRYVHLWVGIILHGIVVEAISYNLPDIDNFWHSQTPIILIGRRLPLHIILVYVVFIYNASIAVKQLRLPAWSEPFAVGLITVLIDIPYDIVSVRFLHWSWHATDPNIYDRHYFVPWNSYYFHAAFAASFTFFFHGTRRLFTESKEQWTASKSCFKETVCTVLPALLGMPGGVLLFLPLYHPLHDHYGIHSEVTFFFLFTVFLVLAWSGDRCSLKKNSIVSNRTIDYIIPVYLLVYYSLFLGLTIIGDPSKEVSIGFHERIGPCDEIVGITSALGQTLYKNKYLCTENNREDYIGWDCLPGGKPPRHGSHWYTACGTPLKNRTEYITVLATIFIAAFAVFTNCFLCGNNNGKVVDAKKTGQVISSKKVKKN